MTFVTLTPSATTASTGALTGSSVHAALSDSSDSTYVTYDSGEYSEIAFGDLSLPSGAQIVSAQLRLRCAKTSGAPSLSGNFVAGLSGYNASSVTWASAQDMGSVFQFGGLTDSALDALEARIACLGSSAQARVYEAYVQVLYLTKPVATVSSPGGTISTNLATVNWGGSFDVHSTSSPAYSDVKVFSAAQYGAGGFDPSASAAVCSSGVEYGAATSRAFDERLPDGAYRAYVRIAPGNASSLWSDWDYEAFTVSASLPGEPSVTLTGEDDEGRVRIDVDCGADTDSVQVQRDAGDGFVNVRTADGEGSVAFTDVGTLYDYEAPNGVTCTYRVRAYDESNATYSDWVEDTVSWSSDDAWLKCVGDPSLNVSLVARSYESFDVPANQGVFRVLGSQTATVINDVPGPQSGQVTFMTRSDDDRDALGLLLASGSPVLLQVNGHPDRLVSLGDRNSTRLVDKGWIKDHDDTLNWTLVGEDGRVVGVGSWPYADAVPVTGLALFLPLGASAGLTDLSGNSRNGTAVGGLTAGGVATGPLVWEDNGATDFDGTDDRITTTYSTRRNLWINPSFETNITGITNSTCTTARSSTQAKFDTYSCQVTSTGAGAAPNTSPAISTIAATAGTTYTFSFYLYHTVAGRQGRADLRFYDASDVLIGSLTAGTAATATQNTWTRFSVTATAPAGTAKVGFVCRCDVTSAGSSGEVSYIDGLLIEAASSAGTYFDGTGYVNDSGTWVADAGGHVGWLGTAHASASDIGCFANGTSRTFMGWAKRDTTGNYHALFGVSSSTGAPVLRIVSGNRNVQWFSGNGGGTTWPDAWPGTGQWVHWALVFNSPAATASLYINGQLVSTQAHADPYLLPLSQDFRIGATGGGAYFDGGLAWVSAHGRALTATEILTAYNAGQGIATLGPYLT